MFFVFFLCEYWYFYLGVLRSCCENLCMSKKSATFALEIGNELVTLTFEIPDDPQNDV